MFPRSCLCCPSSFTAPVDDDGGERHLAPKSVDNHFDWCPADTKVAMSDSSELLGKNILGIQQEDSVHIDRDLPVKSVSSELRKYTKDDLENYVQKQLLQRIKENHRANQLRLKVNQTEAMINKYQRNLDSLQKYISDLSAVANSFIMPDNASHSSVNHLKRLTRSIGVQTSAKSSQNDSEQVTPEEMIGDNNFPLLATESIPLEIIYADENKASETIIRVQKFVSDRRQSSSHNLEKQQEVSLPLGEVTSTGTTTEPSLENQFSMPEAMPEKTIKRCCEEVSEISDAQSMQSTESGKLVSHPTPYVNDKQPLSIEVDLTLSDGENEAQNDDKTVREEAFMTSSSTMLSKTLFVANQNSSSPESQRDLGEVNQRSTTVIVESPFTSSSPCLVLSNNLPSVPECSTNRKRPLTPESYESSETKQRKKTPTPETDPTSTLDREFATSTTNHIIAPETSSRADSFPPRVPVIVSVTSIPGIPTSSVSSFSKPALIPRQGDLNVNCYNMGATTVDEQVLYYKWKLPSASPTRFKSVPTQRTPVQPVSVVQPLQIVQPFSVDSGSPSQAPKQPLTADLKSGILLDLSTTSKERRPLLVRPNPNKPSAPPLIRPVARHPDRLHETLLPEGTHYPKPCNEVRSDSVATLPSRIPANHPYAYSHFTDASFSCGMLPPSFLPFAPIQDEQQSRSQALFNLINKPYAMESINHNLRTQPGNTGIVCAPDSVLPAPSKLPVNSLSISESKKNHFTARHDIPGKFCCTETTASSWPGLSNNMSNWPPLSNGLINPEKNLISPSAFHRVAPTMHNNLRSDKSKLDLRSYKKKHHYSSYGCKELCCVAPVARSEVQVASLKLPSPATLSLSRNLPSITESTIQSFKLDSVPPRRNKELLVPSSSLQTSTQAKRGTSFDCNQNVKDKTTAVMHSKATKHLNTKCITLLNAPNKQTVAISRGIPDLISINNRHTQPVMNNHPASLPEHLDVKQHYLSEGFKPLLKITRVPDGLELKWTISLLPKTKMDEITHYELYSYQENSSTAPSSDLWKLVGSIRALPLPMGCILSKFAKGFRYHFKLRTMLRHGSAGRTNSSPFSDFISVTYE